MLLAGGRGAGEVRARCQHEQAAFEGNSRSGRGGPFPLQPADHLRNEKLQLTQHERGGLPSARQRLDAIQPGDDGTRLLHKRRVKPSV